MTALAGNQVPQSMDMPMCTSFDLPFPHYAVIYMDNMGKLKVSASASVYPQHDTLFTADMRERFLEIHRSLIRRPFSSSAYPHGYAQSEDFSYQVKGYRTSIQDPAFDIHLSSQDSGSTEGFPQYPSTNMVDIEIGDAENILEYFQQSNCRQIAKAFIRSIEPHKRTKYPYNGRPRAGGASGETLDSEKTKPEWWPAGVVHREPDHLRKEQCIRLLIHIVRKLGRFGITSDILQAVAYESRRQLRPTNKIEILDEIFKVRRMEERYERSEINATTMVYVVNQGANQKGDKDSEPKQKADAEDVGEVDEGFLTPALSAQQTQTSFASVDMTMGASHPRYLGDDRDQLFPLPESLGFKKQPRTESTYCHATSDYSEGYGRGLLKSPVPLRMVGTSDQTGSFEYLAPAPVTTSTFDESGTDEWSASRSDINAAISMQHPISYHDSWTLTCHQKVFNPMGYDTAADQIFFQTAASSTMLIPPPSHGPYMPHGLADPIDHKPAVTRPGTMMASHNSATT